MSSIEIRQRTTKVFQDVFDEATLEITRATTAEDIDTWDSLTHLSLIVALQQEFDIKFSVGELQELHNVGVLLDVIARKMPPV